MFAGPAAVQMNFAVTIQADCQAACEIVQALAAPAVNVMDFGRPVSADLAAYVFA